jgi:TRAP-type C4-dicarboxylate transport system permease small subunit
VLRVFDLGLRVLACLLLMSLLLCVMAGIVTRALGEPLIWTDEGSRFLMAWLAGTGWMIAARSRAHVRIRFFHNLLPPRAWEASEVVIQLATVVFGLTVAWFGIELVLRNTTIDATSLPLSMAWLYFPLVPAALLVAAQAAANAVIYRKKSIEKDAEVALK